MDVEQLLARPESKTLEFKRDLSSMAGILKTVSAFANTAGGTLLIGVDDAQIERGTRAVRGVEDALRAEEQLANVISDGIAPQILVEIEIVAFRDKSLLLLQAFPGPARPYHVAKYGVEKGSYVRVGSTNRPAGPELLEALRRANTGLTYDEQPLPDLDFDAIDFRAASEQFAPGRKLRRRDLLTLGITKRLAGREVPTIGGMLLFGHDRLRVFPDAGIQIARFEGEDRTDMLDMQSIDDLPVPALERSLELVGQYTRRRYAIVGARRQSVGHVPASALREAIVNAVVHADYSQRGCRISIAVFSDRVEIQSPGLLPLGITIEDIRAGHSKLRNRVMGRVFQELGLIEQWGTGVQRMISACRRAGIAEPRFEELGVQFRVLFPFMESPGEHPTGREGEILDLLRESDSLSTAEIAEAICRTPRTVRTNLRQLSDAGHVIAVGSGLHDPKRRYRITHRRGSGK